MKTIAISGSNGFVGTNLFSHFENLGFEVIKISRDDLSSPESLNDKINQADIVINLAGANIINRWSDEYKKELYKSRIDTTQKIVKTINQATFKPTLFISTSAIGIYDNKKTYDEYNAEFSDDFLSVLCQDWEEEAQKATCRTVIFRFGIVLGNGGGALDKMLTPFKLGLGGVIGSGKQAFSFIHIEDLKNAFLYAIDNDTLHDAYNLCATIPTTNNGLTKALGNALDKPTFFKVPAFILKLQLGEGAKVLLDGQAVVPKRLKESGFKFKYETIECAIDNLLKEDLEKIE
jgi:hypothetical protein